MNLKEYWLKLKIFKTITKLWRYQWVTSIKRRDFLQWELSIFKTYSSQLGRTGRGLHCEHSAEQQTAMVSIQCLAEFLTLTWLSASCNNYAMLLSHSKVGVKHTALMGQPLCPLNMGNLVCSQPTDNWATCVSDTSSISVCPAWLTFFYYHANEY